MGHAADAAIPARLFDEEAITEHAGHDLVLHGRQETVIQLPDVAQQRHVAVVRDHPLTPNRLTAELHELTRHVGARHRDHLDGQGVGAEDIDQLAVVDDADELSGGGGDHLLPGERRTAALDERTVPRRLIGPVDVQVEVALRIEIQFRNSGAAQRIRGLA